MILSSLRCLKIDHIWKLRVFSVFFWKCKWRNGSLKNYKSNFVSMHLVHFCKMSVLDLYIHMSKTCNCFLFSGRHFILCLMWTIQLNIINVCKFNWIFSLNSINVISSVLWSLRKKVYRNNFIVIHEWQFYHLNTFFNVFIQDFRWLLTFQRTKKLTSSVLTVTSNFGIIVRKFLILLQI